MPDKSNEPTPQRPEGPRVIDADQVHIDLPFFIAELKKEEAWKTSDRNAVTVFKTDGLRIVAVALHDGAEMSTHTADALLSLQLLEGEIAFQAAGKTTVLTPGQLFCLHAGIPHAVRALKESVFVLSLAG